MTDRIETQVLVVGGGPVGLTLAMDLARRGIRTVVAELRHKGAPVTAMGIDHVLWYRGQGERYRQGPRRHRTRTIFY